VELLQRVAPLAALGALAVREAFSVQVLPDAVLIMVKKKYIY
jgi:hypothetical protein